MIGLIETCSVWGGGGGGGGGGGDKQGLCQAEYVGLFTKKITWYRQTDIRLT
jgi:hypothetical protein